MINFIDLKTLNFRKNFKRDFVYSQNYYYQNFEKDFIKISYCYCYFKKDYQNFNSNYSIKSYFPQSYCQYFEKDYFNFDFNSCYFIGRDYLKYYYYFKMDLNYSIKMDFLQNYYYSCYPYFPNLSLNSYFPCLLAYSYLQNHPYLVH